MFFGNNIISKRQTQPCSLPGWFCCKEWLKYFIYYFYALGDEMHRAIRLVVDAGMHAKGWTREQAIEYMRGNEPITEQSATAEIERYMALPGQALSYKVGEIKIKELRDKYIKQLGQKFTLSAFHDELLKDGAMPLSVLESKMHAWAAKQL